MSRELFDKHSDQLNDIGREPIECTLDDDIRRNHIKDRILSFLRQNRNEWVPSGALIPINHRFSASIYSLRNDGHVIEKQRSEHGYEWRYVGKIAVDRVSDEWKEAYYLGEHWRSVRSRRLAIDGYRCCLCSESSNLHVHHWEYHLFEEVMRELATLCADCHRYIHGTVVIAFPKSLQVHVIERLDTTE